MSKRMRLAAAFVAALGSALAVFAPAQAQGPGVVIGTLSCSVASGFGFIFGSSRAINCTFAGPGGRYEHYVRNISKVGVDIGYTQGGVIIWTDVSPTSPLVPGALAGNYLGPTSAAPVALGVGANA